MKNMNIVNMGTVQKWIDRYGPLARFLDHTNGYGRFIIKLHGRRCVSVAPVDDDEKFGTAQTHIINLKKQE